MTQRERTFLMCKPAAAQRGIIGPIIKRFERRGFKLIGMKFMQPTISLAESHYGEHKGKDFFEKIVTGLASGPVVAMVWEGDNVIKAARTMMGKTNPIDSEPGTIRGDFAIHPGRNCIHGSANAEDAAREIALWFKPEELMVWDRILDKFIYEWGFTLRYSII